MKNQRQATEASGKSLAEAGGWLSGLIKASTPVEVGEVIVALAQSLTGCDRAYLLWGDTDELQPYKEGLTASTSASEQACVEGALAGDGLCLSEDGRLAAWRLLTDESVMLLLHFSDGQAATRLSGALQPGLSLACRRLRQALDLADLHHSHWQLERSETLQCALFAISDLAGSELDMPELLRGIHKIISTLMYGENFIIVRLDPERGTLRFLYYADVQDEEAPDTAGEELLEDRRGSLTWHLLTGGKPLMGSLQQLREQVGGSLAVSGPECVDWLGVPMLRNSQVYGALIVQSYLDGISFSDEDRSVLQFVCSHILTALERKQSKDELEERVRQRTQELAVANRFLQEEVVERQRAARLQATLFHLAQLATADLNEGEFYQRVHAAVGELLNAENFFIALVDKAAQAIRFVFYVDVTGEVYVDRPLAHGLSEYVLEHGPLVVDHEGVLDMAERGLVDVDSVGKVAVCWLGVPLTVGDEVIGLVAVQSYVEKSSYSAADREFLSFASLQIANSIHRRNSAASLHEANALLEQRVEERTRELRLQIHQREQIQEQLKHQVMHDPLTGLPNRGLLRDRLERVLARLKREPSRHCALLYLDIDRFKLINDSLGHLTGDKFLQEVANRLLLCVRDPDLVARISGDEFAILLEDVPLPGTAISVAQRILHLLGQPLHLAGRELQPSASIGIAIGDNSHSSADEVLHDADIALYRAKEKGRNCFELFDEALARNMVDVLTLEGELRHALQEDEFEPYFQPICRLDGGQVVGYEALIRWNHPRRGVLTPGHFMKIAEDIGLIESIDWRMFELSCLLLAQHGSPDTFMTFNVSARHLRHADFDMQLIELLERTGVPAARLIAEVTEGALLDNPERVRATLDRLRLVGVGAALDDFGTGYSSLSYLHSLPLRMLKIDQAFVQQLGHGNPTSSTPVVAAILALARALNLQVIAEGIETPAQRDALLSMGCEMGQGYLLGRPAPIRQWLEPHVP